MKTSIATVSISGTLPEKLAAIAKAGFDGVEIFENDFLTFDGKPEDVGNMVRDHGLAITLFQPFRDFEGMPDPYRQRAFDRAEKKFDIMQKLGADMLLVCSNLSAVCLGGIERAADDFRELGERAKQRGIKIGFEALAWGKHIYDHRDAWKVVQQADHPNIGLILDSFHSLSRGIDSQTIKSIDKDKLFLVQLADAPLLDMDLLYWSRHYRNMPGEGDLAVKDFTAAITDIGYDGYFSLEIFNDRFRGGSPFLIAHDGHRSLLNLADSVRRQTHSKTLHLKKMPAPIKVNGIDFIEFSTDNKQASALFSLLAQLGFKKSGQHKTKNVDLFTQGDIRLIVNRDENGFSNLSFVMHGTMAYAVALNVDDAEAAFKRAVALDSVPFEQAVPDGQTKIPAIRGVGGGIIYFIDDKSGLKDFAINDFEPVVSDNKVATARTSSKDAEIIDANLIDAGLLHIDHIAQTVDFDEMLSWVLFYTSIFDVQKTPAVDIIDPSGIIRSQVIANEAGSLRITLNGAENRHTLAGHFIADKFGAGIQHIAFLTDDIFKTAKTLRHNGFKTLKISPNYFDDVEARFGLDEAFCQKLRENHILFDSDENGDYFQLYSETYGEGFFFEVVQRQAKGENSKKPYDGYGAANAIFRISAQKKQITPRGMPKITASPKD
ncbi:bifunctional sugar phosphate isomerase/epimerase/4-hydroxyphenylpyruvate dioxygenase family protein [Bartonella sp. HY038]|uniref:bifunctional sugar phosphate isomerase/epimerase/4-hydroxyphenylpyruvate dioxygenase family protein n=1 Tax=Bartonella sp. HY038 TaxID=2759660 RepID=UPI0015F8DF2A|nr:sugar phosphate isomerase/epimerase and 4-hydroxyphenylpyruvate domain-containing protein [Bartonella sp. HY038]